MSNPTRAFKQGEYVHLLNTGNTYSDFSKYNHGGVLNKGIGETVVNYAKRYKPCNIHIEEGFCTHNITHETWKNTSVKINSGYYTSSDLSLRTDLRWKIKAISQNHNFEYYIISSNKNHMLVCNSGAIGKLN